MVRVRRIVYASYETPDIERQVEYFTEILGLSLTERSNGAIYLGGGLDHHCVVLRSGPEAKCAGIGFEIAPDDDLLDFDRQTKGAGLVTKLRTDPAPSIDRLLSFQDPKGTYIEVFRRERPSGQGILRKGIGPNKLGHVAFHVQDLHKVVDFYCSVLGFRISDRMGDVFAFLRCGPDHHTINLAATGTNRHFHTAFELRDWPHLQLACDFLSQRGYKTIWGPGRHGIGHNLFAYHRSPNGLITEVFSEMDQMKDEQLGYFDPRPWHRDVPQRPKVWPVDPTSSNLWGPQAPEEMMA